jgi:hypothetical protein
MNAQLKRLHRAKNSAMVFKNTDGLCVSGLAIMDGFGFHDNNTYTY